MHFAADGRAGGLDIDNDSVASDGGADDTDNLDNCGFAVKGGMWGQPEVVTVDRKTLEAKTNKDLKELLKQQNKSMVWLRNKNDYINCLHVGVGNRRWEFREIEVG